MDQLKRLERRLSREKTARQEAERLLEEKARELWEANQKLEAEATAQSRRADTVERALRVTEERLSNAISTLPYAVSVYNKRQMLVAFNDAFEAPFKDTSLSIDPGLSRGKIIEKTVSLGLADAQIDDADAYARAVEERWTAGDLRDRDFQGGDGEWYRVVERQASSGDFVVMKLNITEEKQREAELDQARVAAEAAALAKSTFLANMSHEIRTPMNGVLGMAELLSETELNDDQKLFANTIRNSAESLLVIINDILDYSKIEAGRMELYPESFNLESAILDVSMILQTKAADKGIDLLIDYDLFLPAQFVGDPGRIRQVLLNLMGNAVKFTEAGSVSISIVGFEESSEVFDLRILVEDTGIGIPKEKLGQIFGEFRQVEEESNRKYEGTGLGLSISKQLIELMGGEIWVESVFGEGSSFGFRLRLPTDPSQPVEAPKAARAHKRVLVVDDVARNRLILERQLSLLDQKVVLADSAEAALEVLRQDTEFDVILTDHRMPGKTGFDLFDTLKDMSINVPTVLMTSDMNIDQPTAIAHGFMGFLTKPMLRSDLINAFDRIFDPDLIVKGGVSGKSVTGKIGKGEILQAGSSELSDGPTISILLAEDNKTNQLVFKKMVGNMNIDLRIAGNGLEALEAFDAERPDLIFTDISMPEMDGVEATLEMRKREGDHPKVPIYALTAHAMPGDKEKFLEAGMDGYLTKPLKKQILIETIEKHLAEKRAAAA